MMATPRISSERLWARLMALGQDGALAGGGVNRQALSSEEILAWRRLIDWAGEAGLVSRRAVFSTEPLEHSRRWKP